MSEVVERAVQSAWAELRRQGDEPSVRGVYIDPEIGLIDGDVDMPALVRAVILSMREPTVGMTIAGYRPDLKWTVFDSYPLQDQVWRAMIDEAANQHPQDVDGG